MDRIKAILFDHDGTLVDSEQVHFEMWRKILDSYGVALDIGEYAKHYAGIPTTTNAEKIAGNYPALSPSATALTTAKNLATQCYLGNSSFPLMPGAKESLNFFHQKKLMIAVVTGAGADGVKTTIRANNLHEHVATVVSGDDVKNSKPAPDPYLLAIQRLGVKSTECIAIEDTENGVTAATKAKIPCLAVAHSMSSHHNFCDALNVFGNLNEATSWIISNFELVPSR